MKVAFRLLRIDDRDRLLVWRNSPDVAAYMYTDRRIGRAEHAAWFTAIPGDRRRAYWIIEIDGVPGGLVNLYDINAEHRRASFGFYLADPARRGRGIGAYVLYRLLRHVFEAMGLRKLSCEVLITNERALNLYRAFGFQQEAYLRQHIARENGYTDVIMLGLLAEEWTAARTEIEARLAGLGFPLIGGEMGQPAPAPLRSPA